jgi:hypothetical protein
VRVKTEAGRITHNSTVDKLSEHFGDNYLDGHQFLDQIYKSLDAHMTVTNLNCSVSVLLIVPGHPLFKYSRSELGEGGRYYLQVLVMAKSNATTSLSRRRYGDDPPTG